MPSSNTTTTSTDDSIPRNDLIQQILCRGTKLRNAMVQSILDHDPFNTEIFNDYQVNSLIPTRLRKSLPSQCSSLTTIPTDIDKQKLRSFLKGESMNQRDQVEALETFRSMSGEDVCKIANDAFSSKCVCSTCLKYNNQDLSCDLNRLKKTSNPKEEHVKKKQKVNVTQKNCEIRKYLKYVDCLQVTIHNFKLNDQGNKRVNSYLPSDKKTLQWGSSTFFIEYEIPFVFSVSTVGKKHKAPFTSSSTENFVRICSRQTTVEAVQFRHSSMHNIKNVDQINLGGIRLKFQISCRKMKQKTVIPVGYALFKFENFESSSCLTCIEELPVILNDTIPIVLGSLCVTLRLGYGKLHFGNEFIACFEKNETHPKVFQAINNVNHDNLTEETAHIKKKSTEEEGNLKFLPEKKNNSETIKIAYKNDKKTSPLEITTVLFGFLYIPEAQYTKADINSFITCRPFCQDDICYSDIVKDKSNPIFNFSQLVPLIYDEVFLQKVRDNFMVIEFWEKLKTKEVLLGSAKLPLNQFYLAYRSADITKYLLKNKSPVISSDGWEVITNPYTNEIVGQVQVLLALGSEQQIGNLQTERGFKKNSVHAISKIPLERSINFISQEKTEISSSKKEVLPRCLEKTTFKSSIKSISTHKNTKDQAVQFDSEMDSEIPNKEDSEQNGKLDQILNHLIAMKNQQEEAKQNGNIEEEKDTLYTKESKDSLVTLGTPDSSILHSNHQYQNMSPLVRSTSDLLNSLQAALSVPPPVRQAITSNKNQSQPTKIDKKYNKLPNSFKVHIAINQAMHLPIRKKCKAKRNKGKSVKIDDNVKPSSYVTFETMPGLDMIMTPLIQKSTTPEWKYQCDVILPVDLLTNSNKRLIFKVWRKSTNTKMVPNLQTDSIIGFAALDLTVLLSGLPNIKGWFNIVDISSKCNGQINIHVTPLEDLSIFKTPKVDFQSCTSTTFNPEENKSSCSLQKIIPPIGYPNNIHSELELEDDGDGELLSRALKRKFAELDEITQRLRLRLSHVTSDETEEDNDEEAEQFERDINTLSIEEDFDMVNFEDVVSNNGPQVTDLLQIECCSESSTKSSSVQNALCISTEDKNDDKDVEESLSILDRQILIGKQRIDTLLGKLSLISGEMNSSRYVSGCSGSNCEEPVNIDTEEILKDLNRHSRPNIHASTSYDKAMFQQIYEYPENASASEDNDSSSTSVISHLEESRAAPDGEGNMSEERNRNKKM